MIYSPKNLPVNCSVVGTLGTVMYRKTGTCTAAPIYVKLQLYYGWCLPDSVSVLLYILSEVLEKVKTKNKRPILTNGSNQGWCYTYIILKKIRIDWALI